MAVKNFSAGATLTASDVNTYLNSGGLVYVSETTVSGGSSTSVSLNNCFSSKYDNYRVVITNFRPGTNGRGLGLRMRAGGVDASTADYFYAIYGYYTTGATASDFASAGNSYFNSGLYSSTNVLDISNASFDIMNPYKAERTFIIGTSQGYDANFFYRTGFGEHNLTNAYDGFTLYVIGTGNITNIKIKVYGYRQA